MNPIITQSPPSASPPNGAPQPHPWLGVRYVDNRRLLLPAVLQRDKFEFKKRVDLVTLQDRWEKNYGNCPDHTESWEKDPRFLSAPLYRVWPCTFTPEKDVAETHIPGSNPKKREYIEPHFVDITFSDEAIQKLDKVVNTYAIDRSAQEHTEEHSEAERYKGEWQLISIVIRIAAGSPFMQIATVFTPRNGTSVCFDREDPDYLTARISPRRLWTTEVSYHGISKLWPLFFSLVDGRDPEEPQNSAPLIGGTWSTPAWRPSLTLAEDRLNPLDPSQEYTYDNWFFLNEGVKPFLELRDGIATPYKLVGKDENKEDALWTYIASSVVRCPNGKLPGENTPFAQDNAFAKYSLRFTVASDAYQLLSFQSRLYAAVLDQLSSPGHSLKSKISPAELRQMINSQEVLLQSLLASEMFAGDAARTYLRVMWNLCRVDLHLQTSRHLSDRILNAAEGIEARQAKERSDRQSRLLHLISCFALGSFLAAALGSTNYPKNLFIPRVAAYLNELWGHVPLLGRTPIEEPWLFRAVLLLAPVLLAMLFYLRLGARRTLDNSRSSALNSTIQTVKKCPLWQFYAREVQKTLQQKG